MQVKGLVEQEGKKDLLEVKFRVVVLEREARRQARDNAAMLIAHTECPGKELN